MVEVFNILLLSQESFVQINWHCFFFFFDVIISGNLLPKNISMYLTELDVGISEVFKYIRGKNSFPERKPFYIRISFYQLEFITFPDFHDEIKATSLTNIAMQSRTLMVYVMYKLNITFRMLPFSFPSIV